MKRVAIIIAGGFLAVAGMAMAHKGATGVMKERMDLMSNLGDQTKALVMMVRGRTALDWQVVDQAGEAAMTAAESLPAKFPAGSFMAPSEAKTAILEQPETFAALSTALAKAGEALSQAASQQDEGAFLVAFRGYAQTCKDCHSLFRE